MSVTSPISGKLCLRLLKKAYDQLGELQLHPMITGSGGLTLANHLGVPLLRRS